MLTNPGINNRPHVLLISYCLYVDQFLTCLLQITGVGMNLLIFISYCFLKFFFKKIPLEEINFFPLIFLYLLKMIFKFT